MRLEQVADVIDSVENNRVASWFNGRRSVTMAVQRQPGTNTVAVVDAIKALFPQFRKQLPASVSLDVLNDRSISIRQSVDDVHQHLPDRHPLVDVPDEAVGHRRQPGI